MTTPLLKGQGSAAVRIREILSAAKSFDAGTCSERLRLASQGDLSALASARAVAFEAAGELGMAGVFLFHETGCHEEVSAIFDHAVELVGSA